MRLQKNKHNKRYTQFSCREYHLGLEPHSSEIHNLNHISKTILRWFQKIY